MGSKVATGRDIAAWAVALHGADVSWQCVRSLATVTKLAGIADVLALGDDVVEGNAASRARVHAVLTAIARCSAPANALKRVEQTLRGMQLFDRHLSSMVDARALDSTWS